MSGILLDTHVWLWFLAGNSRLPASLRERIGDPDTPRWLSAISVWEAVLLQDRGRIELGAPFRDWLTEARERLPVHEAPVSTEIALRSRELDLPHEDPADRFIAATTLELELELATADRRLLAAGWLPTLTAR